MLLKYIFNLVFYFIVVSTPFCGKAALAVTSAEQTSPGDLEGLRSAATWRSMGKRG